MKVDEIYEQHIRKLSRKQRLKLLAMTADGLAEPKALGRRRRKITELAGLGKEIWGEVDAQQYVNSARDEWEERAS